MGRFQTISQHDIPVEEDTLFPDPLQLKLTRFSPDRRYRYTLFRQLGDRDNYCAFCAMNPSGASAMADDRTVARCITFAHDWGFGAMFMLNAFALRATDSTELYESKDPVGPRNDYWIRKIAAKAKLIIPSWGKPGGDFGRRGEQVSRILRESCDSDKVKCFGFNKDGTPKHPLYQRANSVLIPFFR
jgi:hypothetical protein